MNQATATSSIEFKVKFITPLLIFGAEQGQLDSAGLTGKALRGCWRFWFRAMAGGMVPNISAEKLQKLEASIFGSDDENIGAKFRLKIVPVNDLQAQKFGLGFNKPRTYIELTLPGYPPNSEFIIKILPRGTLQEREIRILQASIWLWGHLGAIGRRSRRGFGSPIIGTFGKSNIFESLELNYCPEFTDRDNMINVLGRYLKGGLGKVEDQFGEWLTYSLRETPEVEVLQLSKDNFIPLESPFFTLQGFHQIGIGCEPLVELSRSIKMMHGSSSCDALGYADSHGHMSSPIFTRFYSYSDNEKTLFLPVVTVCLQSGAPVKCGDHLDCVDNYLVQGNIDRWLNESFC